jgi:hypothetical protein
LREKDVYVATSNLKNTLSCGCGKEDYLAKDKWKKIAWIPYGYFLPTNRKFMTAEEAAAFLGGLNARTVTRWAREGYLPTYPIGEYGASSRSILKHGCLRGGRGGQMPLDNWAGRVKLFLATDAPTGGFIQ